MVGMQKWDEGETGNRSTSAASVRVKPSSIVIELSAYTCKCLRIHARRESVVVGQFTKATPAAFLITINSTAFDGKVPFPVKVADVQRVRLVQEENVICKLFW